MLQMKRYEQRTGQGIHSKAVWALRADKNMVNNGLVQDLQYGRFG
jgi:hypothetical protein